MNRKMMCIALLGVLLSGCAARDHMYVDGVCVTCFNNPLTGEPINYDPEENPQMTAEARDRIERRDGVMSPERQALLASQSGTFEFVSPMDVDLVYARLRNEFNMRSPASFDGGFNDSLAQRDMAYHHETTPGTFYNISDYSRHTMNGVEYRIVFRAILMREGSGTLVRIQYSPSGYNDYDGAEFNKSLQSRVVRLLR